MNARQTKITIIYVLIGLAIIGSGVAAYIPSVKDRFKNAILGQNRIILAKTEFLMGTSAMRLVIFLVDDIRELSLEIFQINQDGVPQSLMQKINLEGQSEGYLHFRGSVYNLLMMDLDMDGSGELIVPGFDLQQQSRLNVFKFNPAILRFEKIEGPTLDFLLRSQSL